MVLIKEIELALRPEKHEVQAQEDEILADSVLELANTDFSKVDEHEDVFPGAIRKHVEADMRVAYPGKPTSRKKVFKKELKGDIAVKEDIPVKEHYKSSLSSGKDSQSDVDSSSTSEEEGKPDSEVESDIVDDDENSEGADLDLDSDFDGSILPDDDDVPERPPEVDAETALQDSEGIDIFSSRARDIQSDIAKGKSISNQLTIWDKLIECRIKLQPTLLNANKLYQKKSFQDFKSSLNSDEEENVTQSYSAFADLMKGLLELQENLLNLAPEYQQIKAHKRKAMEDDISSEQENSESKKSKTEKNLLNEIHEEFKAFRNASIQKWNEKTRVSSGKINKNDFSAFDLPTLKQIEEILLDRERLLKRSRTKRSDYLILGKSADTIQEAEPNDSIKKNNLNDYDPEIFDDDDFYHKLLRDFIEKKTSNTTDVSKRGKQWLELQKLRSRMKSKVDTRASKGRKLRFTVHNKMVNFMAPFPSYSWSDEAKNELFKSLFH